MTGAATAAAAPAGFARFTDAAARAVHLVEIWIGIFVGAVTFTIVDEILIDFGQLRQVAYGILVIVLFLWMPRGLIPSLDSLWRRVRVQVEARERLKKISPNTQDTLDTKRKKLKKS